MPVIHDAEGAELGTISLSENQLKAVEATEITVLYHTPQLLRGTLGGRNGSFTLRKDGERIVSDSPAAVREYISLQKAIKALRETT